MLQALIIAFRESLEILIVITALITYLTKINRKDLGKYLYIGCVSGLLASTAVGTILYSQLATLQGTAKQFFEGSMMFFVAGLILYNIIWVGNQKKYSNTPIEEKYNIRSTAISLFLLSFLTVFRECLEIVIFVLPLLIINPLSVSFGILAGAGISIIIMYVIFKTTSMLNINLVFTFLNIVLIAIGALMFGEGLATFFPKSAESMELAGKLIFGLPLLYIFTKSEIKKYTKKKL